MLHPLHRWRSAALAGAAKGSPEPLSDLHDCLQADEGCPVPETFILRVVGARVGDLRILLPTSGAGTDDAVAGEQFDKGALDDEGALLLKP